jgi:hypothetical protein
MSSVGCSTSTELWTGTVFVASVTVTVYVAGARPQRASLVSVLSWLHAILVSYVCVCVSVSKYACACVRVCVCACVRVCVCVQSTH